MSLRASALRFAPYSASKINVWKQCPRKFNYSYVSKIPREWESSYALDRGTLIHLILEHDADLSIIKEQKDFKTIIKNKFLSKEQIKECFEVVKNFKASKAGISLFSRKRLFAELAIGLDLNMETQEYNSDAFLRGYIDVGFLDEKSNTLLLTDYKTGKYKTKDQQDWSQLLWYGIGLFSKMPFDKIVLVYAYVDHNKLNSRIIYRKDIEKYKKGLWDTIDPIEKDFIYEKKETPLCNWCNYQDHCIADTKFVGINEEEIPF